MPDLAEAEDRNATHRGSPLHAATVPQGFTDEKLRDKRDGR